MLSTTNYNNPHMEESKVVRQYELKIIQISRQLERQRNQKSKLVMEYDLIKTSYDKTKQQLQLKINQLNQNNKAKQVLEKEKASLQATLKHSQYHRKTLFDHMFSNQKNQRHLGFGLSNKVKTQQSILNRLDEINSQYTQRRIEQLNQIIKERNNEVKSISKQYNQLIKQYSKSTNQYQQLISNLKHQNIILMKSKKITNQIQQQIKIARSNIKNQVSLALENQTLVERVNLLVQKVKQSQQYIEKLKKELHQANYKIKQQNIANLSGKSNRENLQIFADKKQNGLFTDFVQIFQQRNIILQQNKKLKKLITKYPQVVQNYQKINQHFEKLQKLTQLQLQNFNLNNQLKKLQKKNKTISLKNNQLAEQLETEIKQKNGSNQYYEKIIQKFKEAFKIINPYFDVYEFDQLQFNKSELQSLKKGKRPNQQTKFKAKALKLQNDLYNTNNQLLLAKEQNQRLGQFIKQEAKKISILQTTNDKLILSLHEKESEKNNELDQQYVQFLLSCYKNLQDQRNSLTIQLKDRQIKILQFMMEISQLKDQINRMGSNKIENIIIGSQLQFDICRPSVVEVKSNPDFDNFAQKLKQFQHLIKKAHNQYEQQIIQDKNQFISQLLQLKQKIIMLQTQNKQLKRMAIPQVPEKQIEVEQQIQQRQQIQEAASILDLDQEIPLTNGEQNQNIMSSQTLKQINRLLNNHQFNLKNLLVSYLSIKQKYQKLKQNQNNDKFSQIILLMEQQIKGLTTDLKSATLRLQQSDQNLIKLQKQLLLKEQDKTHICNIYRNQTENLSAIIKSLRKEIQQLSRQTWYEKPTQVTKKKKYVLLPEELQYFLEILLQKNDECKKLKQSKSQEIKQNPQLSIQGTISQNQSTKKLRLKQSQLINNIFRNGEMMKIIESIKEKLKQFEKPNNNL